MALSVGQRLDRPKIRRDELFYWRWRERVAVTGWTLDGALVGAAA